MVRHKVYARHRGVEVSGRLSIPLIKLCVRSALLLEGVDIPCEVSVMITDDCGVRDINREFRRIDEPTDVLSFPMHEFLPPGWRAPPPGAIDPETGLLPLGDIILSAEQVIRQANDNKQTIEQETAYLTVHSVLHLIGYDHVDEAEGKRRMREREREIMQELGVKDDQ